MLMPDWMWIVIIPISAPGVGDNIFYKDVRLAPLPPLGLPPSRHLAFCLWCTPAWGECPAMKVFGLGGGPNLIPGRPPWGEWQTDREWRFSGLGAAKSLIPGRPPWGLRDCPGLKVSWVGGGKKLDYSWFSGRLVFIFVVGQWADRLGKTLCEKVDASLPTLQESTTLSI